MEHRESPFPCRVVRHRGARRMTLRVSDAGVRLTVPARAPAGRVDAFLRASAPWVAEQSARLAPPPAPLADGDRLAWLDDTLVLRLHAGGRGRVARRGDELHVPAERADARVEAWYRAEALRETGERARARAAAMGVRVAGVAVRDPRTRWGSCAATGRLSFSWRLMLAPEHVLEHVVVHEVCHLRRPDHSPAFWALVEEADPRHAEARAWLRDHGVLLHRGPAWRDAARREGLSPS
ncbi:M48 family metallopeptidase [Miltoncostaea oceani]|uniref:M48 family metallopeptidase n=1 Tax=Miltoncostaea oceani TaxID=2843216 RepID=UPI001C3C6512|nr:YgjP-like metallopeptidase domain-containing protein [Miltoncostaea oceani]